ncbi:MAG: monovalent cation/H+ antiporter subunit D [Rubellimicrobium sp.]|nr:monovalent cation/H+ antiporter subunit D [Rubellimicrobium sp.]
MSYLVMLPLVVPPMVAAVMILGMRHHQGLLRIFSLASILAMLALSILFIQQSADGSVHVHAPGNWRPPFGIVLVLDRLSALMVLLTSLLALVVMLYAIGSGWDARGKHFHPLIQFQLMGIYGAFLTGDLFNLFVFFEVLLIASYGLMIHGGGKRRMQAGLQYVVYNLLGSTLFLFALGTLYAVTGTLNMADMAERVAMMGPEDAALIRVGAVMLLMVFSVKAALVPLHFWLPATYAETPAPVAALFAIMTKVGGYAILRVYTLIFGPDVAATGGIFGPWLMNAALVTIAVGMIGILGSRSMGRVAAYASIASMGTLLVAIALFTPAGILAALFYMIHSTLAAAALFLVVDLIRARRPGESCGLAAAPEMAQAGLLGALYMAAAIAAAGMPPLSGFFGKMLVLDAAFAHDRTGLIWTVILGTSLLAVVGFARAGSAVFWKTSPPSDAPKAAVGTASRTMLETAPSPTLALAATGGLIAAIALVTLLAGPVTAHLDAMTMQLLDREDYLRAVLPLTDTTAPDAPDLPGGDLHEAAP